MLIQKQIWRLNIGSSLVARIESFMVIFSFLCLFIFGIIQNNSLSGFSHIFYSNADTHLSINHGLAFRAQKQGSSHLTHELLAI